MKRAMKFAVVLTSAMLVFSLSGCYRTGSSSFESVKAAKPAPSESDTADVPRATKPAPAPEPDPEPEFEDPRWPTHNSQLLEIPESERWYNASKHVGSTCTVAGPVVNVYQAKQSKGMPIFVDIGEAYPSEGCVTLLIWADSLADFEEMLNDVDDGDAWISVTGYLSSYKGRLQFNIDDGPVQYTWWTHVS